MRIDPSSPIAASSPFRAAKSGSRAAGAETTASPASPPASRLASPFAQELARAQAGGTPSGFGGQAEDGTALSKNRSAAEQLVSQLFFVPLLAEMRALPFGREFGHGGRGEEVFAEQLDLRIADAAAKGDRSGLVDQVERQLAGSRARARSAAPPVASPGAVTTLAP